METKIEPNFSTCPPESFGNCHRVSCLFHFYDDFEVQVGIEISAAFVLLTYDSLSRECFFEEGKRISDFRKWISNEEEEGEKFLYFEEGEEERERWEEEEANLEEMDNENETRVSSFVVYRGFEIIDRWNIYIYIYHEIIQDGTIEVEIW